MTIKATPKLETRVTRIVGFEDGFVHPLEFNGRGKAIHATAEGGDANAGLGIDFNTEVEGGGAADGWCRGRGLAPVGRRR